jgi:hypothetical protein
MRLQEFANTEEQMNLWKIISDSVWKAISVQSQEQVRREQEQALKQKKNPKKSTKAKPLPKPKIPRPQPSKAKKTSAQEIQSQKVQSKSDRSKPQTVLPPTSSVDSVDAQNTVKKRSQNRVPYNPNSVASIQRQLDPLAFDPIVKKLTN